MKQKTPIAQSIERKFRKIFDLKVDLAYEEDVNKQSLIQMRISTLEEMIEEDKKLLPVEREMMIAAKHDNWLSHLTNWDKRLEAATEWFDQTFEQ